MKIAIDAGHGYETPGKRSVDGLKEYEFNRAVAGEMKKLLEKYEGVTVLFTHSDQRDVPLNERTTKANKEKVDVFISIHANAHGNGNQWTSAEGIETYVYTTKPKTATRLAQMVQNELISSTKRKDRGVKTANFHVLKATSMTAILCECGFMTNKEEAALLQTSSYRLTCSKAIVDAIVKYYQLTKIKKTISSSLYKVQVGAFSNKQNAEALAKELKAKGYDTFIVK
ncbi:N-acetylmuramoyl-L-alanine amidase [Metabacillus halosaccharovorans]|uniref:N-acetylmuramoyl-L-alanine amidase n=1 Tax=Metabacillus halosaccharovorans TaxID=930124 RepID=A0ABT3DND1_9BACI|nr:N-acetylmuramoyl-L-alanine amidase [Metabacillus halosaccharovorans]MCV9888117.1 N-acetylmuramoyl-L-alanine amidase [Metabacillus halosaccharovorans]